MKPLVVSLIALGCAALASGCYGTGDGGTGDARHEPQPDPFGNGIRVADVNRPVTWLNSNDPQSLGCELPPNRRVRLTGASIVAIDAYDESGAGAFGNIYVQDVPPPGEPAAPYTGMTIFAPSFSPPALRVFAGDVVDIEGTFFEFLGPASGRFGECKTLPEIGGTMRRRFDGSLVEPLLLVPPEAAPGEDRFAPLKSYEEARAYIGMLVRLENVTLLEPIANAGRYTARIDVGGGIGLPDVPSVSNELYDILEEGPDLAAGSQFASITGVVTYFYGFRIAPRSPDDFVRFAPEE